MHTGTILNIEASTKRFAVAHQYAKLFAKKGKYKKEFAWALKNSFEATEDVAHFLMREEITDRLNSKEGGRVDLKITLFGVIVFKGWNGNSGDVAYFIPDNLRYSSPEACGYEAQESWDSGVVEIHLMDSVKEEISEELYSAIRSAYLLP